MEVIGIYGILFGIVGIFFLIYTYFLYRKNLKIKARIKAEYGKKPEWKLDERDYASMKKYYQQKKTDGPTIDDITFNDLNMDEIFKQVKNTQSSIGDEYSYDFFRRQKNPDLTHFEAAVQCMSEQAEAREKLQFAFYRIGRKTNNQLVELLLEPSKFPKIAMLPIILVTVVGIGSLIWLAVDIDYGILAVCMSF